MTTITATYSPEDNKLRLYASSRLDAETYARVREAGFVWAPKQELFVAPKWTPEREDLAIELAGEIEPEEMTLAERAHLKAERLEGIAHKRNRDANAFHARANELSQAFYMGQPILVGHHSERKARKTQERMHAAMDAAVKLSKDANYWLYRATSVEHHANFKNSPRVRANRIETLLAELRDLQRGVNHAHNVLRLWDRCTTDSQIAAVVRVNAIDTGSVLHWDVGTRIERGELTLQQVRESSIEAANRTINGPQRRRWIEHLLNRLGYERELLGPVPLFAGTITPAMLQIFARTHGAHKPEAKRLPDGSFLLTSPVALPVHLADGNEIEMTPEEWAELMHSVGYEVPAKADAKPPILNLKVSELYAYNKWNRTKEINRFRVAHMTKAEYSKIGTDYRGTRESICGEFRFKICLDPSHTGPAYQRGWVAVFLTDSKAHDVPPSYSPMEEGKTDAA
jgi:hypothetical protein